MLMMTLPSALRPPGSWSASPTFPIGICSICSPHRARRHLLRLGVVCGHLGTSTPSLSMVVSHARCCDCCSSIGAESLARSHPGSSSITAESTTARSRAPPRHPLPLWLSFSEAWPASSSPLLGHITRVRRASHSAPARPLQHSRPRAPCRPPFTLPLSPPSASVAKPSPSCVGHARCHGIHTGR